MNYGRWHYKGLPISSTIDESVVNEVVSLRMAKQRQMRWTDEGARLLAQVRVHAINGDLRPRTFAFPLRPPKPVRGSVEDAYRMRMAAYPPLRPGLLHACPERKWLVTARWQ